MKPPRRSGALWSEDEALPEASEYPISSQQVAPMRQTVVDKSWLRDQPAM